MNLWLLYEKSDHDGVCSQDECVYEAKKYKLKIRNYHTKRNYHKYFLLSEVLPYDVVNVIMIQRVMYELSVYVPYEKVILDHLNWYQKMYVMFELDLENKREVKEFMKRNFGEVVNTKGSYYCILCSSSRMNELGKHDYRLTFY